MSRLLLAVVVYALSLVWVHMQPSLPQFVLVFATWLLSVFSEHANMALHCMGLALAFAVYAAARTLCNNMPVRAHAVGFVVWVAGVACGMGLGQAALYHIQRVAQACHGQSIEGVFKVTEQHIRPLNHVVLQLHHIQAAHQPLTPCTGLLHKAGKVLQTQPMPNAHAALPGELVRIQGVLKSTRSTLGFDGFDAQWYWMSQGVHGLVQVKDWGLVQANHTSNDVYLNFNRWRAQLAQNLVQHLHNHPQLPLVLALALGDQGLIQPEERLMYAQTGIAHLVAVSGLHVAMLAIALGGIVGFLWRQSARACLYLPSPLVVSAVGVLAALAYALLVGWQPPAQRTVWMLFARFALQMRGQHYSPWQTFGLALLLVLVADPFAVHDIGAWLTFATVAILIWVNHRRYVFRSVWPNALRVAVRSQYAVTVGLVVLSAHLFAQQSLVSPLVNALAIPWMSMVATPFSVAGALLQQPWALWLAAESLALQHHVLLWASELEFTAWVLAKPQTWQMVLASLGALVLVLPKGIVPKPIGVALLAVLVLPPPRPAQDSFWVSALDVGQGMAIAVQTKHHVLVFDAGSAWTERSNQGHRVVLPWAWSQGYARLSAFWVSHDDIDHAGGANAVLQHLKPYWFAHSLHTQHPLVQQAEQLQLLQHNCHDLRSWQWDGVTFTPLVLPHNSIHAAKPMQISDNNRSCVLKVSNAQHSVLLAGDVEQFSELALLAQHGSAALRSTVLWAPHHGSKTSSSWPFLQAVSPRIAVVQSGWRNRYGHPHPDVVARYEHQGIQLLNTADLGAIRLRLDVQSQNPSVMWARAKMRYWLGADICKMNVMGNC